MRGLLFLLVLGPSSAQAEEIFIGAFQQWNQGSTIFEIGSRYPDVTGIASGSRITYPRFFATTGLSTSLYFGSFAAQAEVHHTGSGVRSGTARDEDFVMSLNARQEGAKVDLLRGKFRDNQYVFAGGRNFADSEGKTSLQEYGARIKVRDFRGKAAASFPVELSWCLGGELAYQYSKYVIYDAVQYNSPGLNGPSSPFSFTPIGHGLSFTNVVFELVPGGGVQTPLTESFAFSLFAGPALGWEQSRDYHQLRGITFFMENAGSGILYRAELLARKDRWLMRLSYTGHRLYSRGTVHARGLDPIYNLLPPQRMYLNTKEWNARMAVEYRL